MLYLYRFYSALLHRYFLRTVLSRRLTNQNVPSQVTESLTSFHLTKQNLANVDRKFVNLGPKAFLQGSAKNVQDAPKLKLPEVAFVGRTSVGKSSLINALVYQNKLVRTSKQPGHTRQVDFYNVSSKFYLVDLPGYGYVEGLGRQRSSKHFVKVAESYLKERAGKELRSVCLLIDGKVGVKKHDLVAFEMLEEFGAPFQVVLTKMDKLPQQRRQMMVEEVFRIKDVHSSICFPHIFPVSAKQKTGLSELRYFIGLCVGLIK